MGSYSKRTTRSFLRSMHFQANMFACFKGETFIDLLLAKSNEDINIYLLEMVLQIARRSQYLPSVDARHLYVITKNMVCEEDFICVLGEDLLNPSYFIPSVDQLHESFAWHCENKTPESVFYDDVDAFALHLLKDCLLGIEVYATCIESPIKPCRNFFLEEGDSLREELIHRHVALLRKKQKEISRLKHTGAPTFMINDCSEVIETTKSIVSGLGKLSSL